MSKRQSVGACSVCGLELASSKLSRAVVEGRTLLLCRDHAAVVAKSMPRTFEDLRALFPEAPGAEHPGRRSVLTRRGADDRRIFPPRPEGRRIGGRRKDDEAAA